MKFLLLPIVFVAVLSVSAGTWMVLAANGTKHANENKQVPFKYALGQQKFEAMCSDCHFDAGNDDFVFLND